MAASQVSKVIGPSPGTMMINGLNYWGHPYDPRLLKAKAISHTNRKISNAGIWNLFTDLPS